METITSWVSAGSRRYRCRARTTSLVAYDAGAEANNELATHVPGTPFAGFRRAPTSKPITKHTGIQGVGDLKASAWNWQNPVALLTSERVW
jgi:hypothetical protein